MFYLFAKLEFEELQSLLDDIKGKDKLKQDKAYLALIKHFKPLIMKQVNSILKKYDSLNYQHKKDIFDGVSRFLYDTAISKKEYNSVNDFQRHFLTTLKRMPIYIDDILGTKGLSASHPTLVKVRALEKWVEEYKLKNKKIPTVKQIAKDFKYNNKTLKEKQISELLGLSKNKYLVGLDKHISDNDSPTMIERFVTTNQLSMPDDQYMKKEEKMILGQAIKETMAKMKGYITKLRGTDAPTIQSNFEEIMSALLANQGKGQRDIAKTYQVTEKPINRIWTTFLNEMRNNKRLVAWNKAASKNRLINKVSSLLQNDYLAFIINDEKIIQNVIRG